MPQLMFLACFYAGVCHQDIFIPVDLKNNPGEKLIEPFALVLTPPFYKKNYVHFFQKLSMCFNRIHDPGIRDKQDQELNLTGPNC